MPIFDFLCRNCGKEFDVMISNAEKNKVKCPECKSADVKQMLALFNTGGTGKPASAACPGCGAGANSG